jgi:hypothetical protein
MKRSDMVDIIAHAATEFISKMNDSSIQKTWPDYDEASFILDKIQEAGMLPPPDRTDIRGAEKETGVILDISYNNPLNDDYSLNLWEKE